MIRKSVETRDWLNTIEPRTVRAVMKRVVEDVSTMDSEVKLHIFFFNQIWLNMDLKLKVNIGSTLLYIVLLHTRN